VERAIEGDIDHLKERALGVEVFGRPPDYDNYADPIVRISAGEVRKRIAQYYHGPGRDREIRIELPLGSYVPEFFDPLTAPEEAPAIPEPVTADGWQGRSRRVPLLILGAILSAAFAWWRPWVPPHAFDRFWQPFLESGTPVTICLARAMLSPTIPRPGAAPDRPAFLAWPDAATSTKVASLFAAEGQPYQLKRDDTSRSRTSAVDRPC
jgi:hypothetical protein